MALAFYFGMCRVFASYVGRNFCDCHISVHMRSENRHNQVPGMRARCSRHHVLPTDALGRQSLALMSSRGFWQPTARCKTMKALFWGLGTYRDTFFPILIVATVCFCIFGLIMVGSAIRSSLLSLPWSFDLIDLDDTVEVSLYVMHQRISVCLSFERRHSQVLYTTAYVTSL